MIYKKGGELFTAATLATMLAKGHGIGAATHGIGAVAHTHGHLYALHSSLLLHKQHITDVVSVIHKQLSFSGSSAHFLFEPVHHNSLQLWLYNSKITIEHFIEHLVNTILAYPGLSTIKLTGKFIIHGGNLLSPVWNILIGIIFMKVAPKLILVLTGKIPIFECYALFGWQSNALIKIDEDILKETKSYTRDYRVLLNAINHGNEYISEIVDDDYVFTAITNIVRIINDLDVEKKVNTDSLLYVKPESMMLTEYISNFLEKLDDFLLRDFSLHYMIPISNLYEIYGELSNIIIYQSMESNITNLQLLRKNVFSDVIEQLINQVVIFSACSEIYSIFGVHGLHFVKSYIAEFFIAKGVVSQLVNMEQDEVPVMVAAITSSMAIGVSSVNYDNIELPEVLGQFQEEDDRELIQNMFVPVVIKTLNEPIKRKNNKKKQEKRTKKGHASIGDSKIGDSKKRGSTRKRRTAVSQYFQ